MAEESIEKRAERMARRRWWLILIYVAGWFVWQGLMLKPVAVLIARQGLPVGVLSLGGFAVWAVALLLIFRFMAFMRRNRVIAGMLNDELTAANRKQCWTVGYFSLLFALAVAVVAAAFNLVDALTMAQMLTMVAVSVPLLAFVWLERDTGG